MSEAF